jgi:hypothetical protein
VTNFIAAMSLFIAMAFQPATAAPAIDATTAMSRGG